MAATIITAAAVLAAVVSAVRYMLRSRRRGCSGDCASCPHRRSHDK